MNLSDITEEGFIFDFYNGQLPKTEIYSLDELVSLGQQTLGEDENL